MVQVRRAVPDVVLVLTGGAGFAANDVAARIAEVDPDGSFIRHLGRIEERELMGLLADAAATATLSPAFAAVPALPPPLSACQDAAPSGAAAPVGPACAAGDADGADALLAEVAAAGLDADFLLRS